MSTDPETYCSGKGILTFEIGAEYATPPTMMHTDPPDHTRYRSLVQPAFGRRVVKTLDDSVRDAARVLVDALPLDEPVDIVPPLAVPLPVQVIAQLLGLPENQWDRVLGVVRGVDPGHRDLRRRRASRGAQRRDDGRADAPRRRGPHQPGRGRHRLARHHRDRRRRLTDDEIAMFLNQLLVAGNETTRNTISGGLVALAENPDQWARLVADRSLVAGAVEEILRWTTAGHLLHAHRHQGRRARRPGGRRRRADRDGLRLGQPGRGRVRSHRRVVRRGPLAEPPRGLRLRRPLLPGRGAGPPRGGRRARRLLDRGVTRLELAGPVGRSVSNIIAGVTTAPMILHTT